MPGCCWQFTNGHWIPPGTLVEDNGFSVNLAYS
jgi:hypothetical protein